MGIIGSIRIIAKMTSFAGRRADACPQKKVEALGAEITVEGETLISTDILKNHAITVK